MATRRDCIDELMGMGLPYYNAKSLLKIVKRRSKMFPERPFFQFWTNTHEVSLKWTARNTYFITWRKLHEDL